MPITKPTTGSTGWQVAVNAAIDQLNLLEGVGATCRIHAASTAQTLVAADVRIVDLNTVARNESVATFDPELADDRIQVLRAGTYLASWALRFAAATSGARYSSIGINGKYNTAAEVGRTAADQHTQSSSVPIALAANDYVNLCAYVDPTDVGVDSGQPFHTWLSLTYLGAP